MNKRNNFLYALSAFFLMATASCGQTITPPPKSAAPQNAPSMGINLNDVTYYSPEWVFVDAFKMSSGWTLENHPGSGASDDLVLSPTGYPLLKHNQRASTLMFRDIGGHYPAGQYTCFWSGNGELEFKDDARLVSYGQDMAIVDVNPTHNGVRIRINQSDPRNPIRNIRFIMPGFNASYEKQPFHPLFLNRLRGFSVIRFMGWMRTNDSSTRHPIHIPSSIYATQTTERGVAPVYMAELCNELNADPWICIPHLANDDYVRRLAEIMQRQLDPKRQIYIEYSNEMWNWGFGQRRWIDEQAQKLNIPWHEIYVRRSINIFDIFEDVFGSSDRLVRIIGAQAVNTWLGEQLIDAIGSNGKVDALAIAPYFGHSAAEIMASIPAARITVDQLLNAAEQDILNQHNATLQYARLAESLGLRLIAYESGQHLAVSAEEVHDEDKVALFIAANRSPRMAELYRRDMQGWAKAGGGLFVAYKSVYVPKKWGAWGLLEYQDQPAAEAHKYRAVREIQTLWGRPKHR